MSAIEHCPECEAAWERGHKAGRAFMVAQGHDTWKDMHAVVVDQKDALEEQLAGAVEDAEALYALVRQARDKITDTDWCRRADATMAAAALRAREGAVGA